jgi:hypothetical protein
LFIFSIPVRGVRRTSKREEPTNNKDEQSLNEDQLLNERLKAMDDF